MTILVCPLSRVREQIAAHAPARVISLLDPHTPFPEIGYEERHLRVAMHDVPAASDSWTAPARAHIDAVLGFVGAWDRAAPLLVHCYAGISRSSATAYIAACAHNPHADEWEIAAALRSASRHARPNWLMVELADEALGRGGRMIAAIMETGRDLPWIQLNENEPFALPSRFGAGR